MKFNIFQNRKGNFCTPAAEVVLLNSLEDTKPTIPAPTTKPRIEFIDLAKGICITLVVILHCGCNLDNDWISLRHLRMPLYFFLSGIFFKDYGGYYKTILRKTDKLLLPFVFFCSTTILLILSANYIIKGELLNFSYFFIEWRINCNYILPLWFLLSLFWQSILYLMIYKITKNLILQGLFVLSLTILGHILNKNTEYYLPLYIKGALLYLPYFYIGFASKRSNFINSNKNNKSHLLLFFFFLIIGILIYQITKQITSNNSSQIYLIVSILDYAQSVALVLALIIFCKIVNYLPFISYIGRFSIIILVTHMMVNSFVSHSLNLLINLHNNWLYFICTIILCAILIKPIKTHLPYVTSQKNFLSKNF